MDRNLVLLLAALLASPATFAGPFYIGGSIGRSMIDDTAETDALVLGQPGELPGEIPLNGRSFDSEETMYGISLGWQAKDWFAIELGYTDLGETEEKLDFQFFGPAFGIPSATFRPPPDFPGPGIFIAVPRPDVPVLDIEEWSLAAKFRHSLVSKLSANWSVGITHVEFDADGQWRQNVVVSTDPLVLDEVTIPYASPDSEIGYKFGFGFAWAFNDRISADIGYQRHDTQVLDVETLSLKLIFNL